MCRLPAASQLAPNCSHLSSEASQHDFSTNALFSNLRHAPACLVPTAMTCASFPHLSLTLLPHQSAHV